MSNGGSFGWLGAAGSILGVFSTAIGIWVAIATQQLKATSDRQKVRIDAQDAALRASAEQRATTSAQHDYLLKVYDKVIQAVETTDERKQQGALALVESLEDPGLREKLARVFTSATTVRDQSTKAQAQKVQSEASVAVAIGNRNGWDYDVFWCEDPPENVATANRVAAAIIKGDPTHGRVRLRSWSANENVKSGYGVAGYEIRAEASERPQAEHLKKIVDPVAPKPFELKTTTLRTAWYLSVWVCPGK